MSFNRAAPICVYPVDFWQFYKPWDVGIKMLFASSAFETVNHVVLSLFHVDCTVRCTHDHQLNRKKWREPCGGAGAAHKVRLHARLKVWTSLWFWPIFKSLRPLFDRSYPATSMNVACCPPVGPVATLGEKNTTLNNRCCPRNSCSCGNMHFKEKIPWKDSKVSQQAWSRVIFRVMWELSRLFILSGRQYVIGPSKPLCSFWVGLC